MPADHESWPIPVIGLLLCLAGLGGLLLAGALARTLTLEEFAALVLTLALARAGAALATGTGALPLLWGGAHPELAADLGWRRLRRATGAGLAALMAVGLGTLLTTGPLAGPLARIASESEFLAAAPLVGALLILLALSRIVAGAQAAAGRHGLEHAYGPASLFGGPVAVVIALAYLAGIDLNGGGLDIVLALGAIAVALALAGSVGAVLAGGEMGRSAPAPRAPPDEDRLACLALALLASLLSLAEVAILLIKGDFAGLARVGAGLMLILAVLSPIGVAHGCIAPFIRSLTGYGEIAMIERLARAASTAAALVSLLALLPVALMPETVLTAIFGEAYRGAAPFVLALVPGCLVVLAGGGALSVLAAMGRQTSALALVTLGAGLGAGLGWFAIGPFGLAGLGLALSAGLAVSTLTANAVLFARFGLRSAVYVSPRMIGASAAALLDELMRLWPARGMRADVPLDHG
ncbi:MAG: hypothetical protein HXY25_13245 [Alphaproteobacteria bacterium]|nr:hypothetical protein [Alphaproteobacteria bacterium]